MRGDTANGAAAGRRTDGLRVMLYSQDGQGLGHLRRTHSIGARIGARRPDAAILTMSDSPLGPFFKPTPGHDYVKLPSIEKTGPGRWRGVNLALDVGELRALRADLLRAAVRSYRPDILLVDHLPAGAQGELLPTLRALEDAGGDTRVVLGLRDIIDHPDTVKARWAEDDAFAIIERHYDTVLVYGERSLFDVAEEYGFPDHLRSRLRYCGYVCTPAAPSYTRRVRNKYLREREGDRLIVAMAGGGHDAYPMMQALLDAAPAIAAAEPCRLVLIFGPFMPSPLRRQLQLQARSQGLGTVFKTKVSDTLSYIDAADVLVTMAGYNTTVEILRAGRRAVVVPRSGPSAEQRMRARLFGQRGWVHTVDPDALRPEGVADAVLGCLNANGTAPKGSPRLDGLSVAVDELLAHSAAPSEPVLPLDLRPARATGVDARTTPA